MPEVTQEIHASAENAGDPARYLSLAAEHYENFPVGSWLVPRRQRRHLHRIYAFARIADDLADEHRDREGLAALRSGLAAHLDAGAREVPLLADLAATISELELPVELFFDLLDAFTLDLDQHRHDRESLLAYCRKSADPIGRLVLRVFGHRDDRMDALSDRICTGLQILNHLQDVREDLVERDRIYLPREDLERSGVREEDLRAAQATPALAGLVEQWADEVRGRFRDGWELTRLVDGRLRLELRAILGGAAAVLRRLREVHHDVLGVHVRLGRLERLGVLGRALLRRAPPGELA